MCVSYVGHANFPNNAACTGMGVGPPESPRVAALGAFMNRAAKGGGRGGGGSLGSSRAGLEPPSSPSRIKAHKKISAISRAVPTVDFCRVALGPVVSAGMSGKVHSGVVTLRGGEQHEVAVKRFYW